MATKKKGAKSPRTKNNRSASESPVGEEVDRSRRFAHIVARAWSDENFKEQLLGNPDKVFADYALEIPKGVTLRVVENTEQIVHFILPAKPTAPEHISLDRIPIHILDSPCHGHEHSEHSHDSFDSHNTASHGCGLTLRCN